MESVVTLSTEALEFFRTLEEAIWVQRGYIHYRTNISGTSHSAPNWEERRNLTIQEFERILAYVQEYYLPVSIHSSRAGFSFALVVWNGDEAGKREKLIEFESRQIPASCVATCEGKNHDDKVFNFFTSILNNPANLSLLKFYKLELPKERYYYEY
ncbi:MAG: hypothetical protein NTW50_00155 [Candidatus Berkelbacteria bacterium]|nr:hypothetical protein [Candidatus Berkelbacteria bacterium]